MSAVDLNALLARLGLSAVNPGAWSGAHGWSSSAGRRAHQRAQSRRRRAHRAGAPGERRRTTRTSCAARSRPRPPGATVPAPKRGEAVRLLGEELRRHKTGPRHAGLARERQDPRRGPGRSAGDDRHRRLRRRPVAHALRPHHALRAPAAPHVRAVASARASSASSRRSTSRSPCGRGTRCLGAICGNACVWKPSPKTPLTALAVQQLCNRVMKARGPAADLPALHRCRHRARDALRRRPARRARLLHRLDRRSAARSASASPRAWARACSSSAATTPSSSMRPRISIWRCPAIVFGAVGTAGQRCTTHAARVRARSAIAAELERRLVHAYRQVRIGDPLETGTLMGPLIDAARGGALSARRSPRRRPPAASCCTAARCSKGPGNFVEPAIVRARNEWPIVQTETFAPILYLIPVDSLERGHRAAERRRAHGLSSALFTDRLQNAETLPLGGRQRLRHRQHQPRHLGRRDRRRLRRREGHRRRPRVRLGCLEGLHAPPDQHDQLEPRAAARPGDRVQGRP